MSDDKKKKVKIGEVFLEGARLSFADLWDTEEVQQQTGRRGQEGQVQSKTSFCPRITPLRGSISGKRCPR